MNKRKWSTNQTRSRSRSRSKPKDAKMKDLSKYKPMPPKPVPVMSRSVSIEEYFERGMQQYFTEMEMAARAARDAEALLKPPTREPSYGVLEDALATQLQRLKMITRAVQTDWRWHTMAVRWRHARILESTIRRPLVPITRLKVDHEQVPPSPTVTKPSTQSVAESPTVVRSTTQSLDEIPTAARAPAQGVDESLAMVEEATEGPTEGPAGPDEGPTGPTESPTEAKEPAQSDEETAAAVIESATQSGEESPTEEGDESKPSAAKGHKKKHKKRVTRYSTAMQQALSNRQDKCVDTSDLEFNPYDPNMKYTPAPKESDKFTTLISSVFILRWRNRAREKIEERGGAAKPKLPSLQETEEAQPGQEGTATTTARASATGKPSKTWADEKAPTAFGKLASEEQSKSAGLSPVGEMGPQEDEEESAQGGK